MQAGLLKGIDPIAPVVTARYQGGSYKVPGRELSIKFKITNKGNEPLKIGEFASERGDCAFLNPDIATLSLRTIRSVACCDYDDHPMTVVVQDAPLSDLAYDTDSQFGGLLFLFDPSGKRYKLEIGRPG